MVFSNGLQILWTYGDLISLDFLMVTYHKHSLLLLILKKRKIKT